MLYVRLRLKDLDCHIYALEKYIEHRKLIKHNICYRHMSETIVRILDLFYLSLTRIKARKYFKIGFL